MSYKYNYVT